MIEACVAQVASVAFASPRLNPSMNCCTVAITAGSDDAARIGALVIAMARIASEGFSSASSARCWPRRELRLSAGNFRASQAHPGAKETA